MTPAAAARARTPRCVFDGQSLNFAPIGSGGANMYPYKTMAYFPGVNWNNIGVSGTSWTVLAASAAGRIDPWAAPSGWSVLLLCGGTSDLLAPESNDGPTVYADMVAYVTARRASGFDYVIATTITPSTSFLAGEETNRQAANALIMADANHAFDAKADFAADSRLANPADTTYYSDGLHWTTAGTQVAADLMAPVLGPTIGAHP